MSKIDDPTRARYYIHNIIERYHSDDVNLPCTDKLQKNIIFPSITSLEIDIDFTKWIFDYFILNIRAEFNCKSCSYEGCTGIMNKLFDEEMVKKFICVCCREFYHFYHHHFENEDDKFKICKKCNGINK